MVHAEGYIDDIWGVFPLELLHVFGREVGVLLAGVYLLPVAPDISVRMRRLDSVPHALVSPALAQLTRQQRTHKHGVEQAQPVPSELGVCLFAVIQS